MHVRRQRLALKTSLSVISLVLSAPATAQERPASDATPTDVGDIVVTARTSLDTSSAQIRRSLPGITDSVTAADIARTTDTTLPEALERVVGVSADAFYGTSDPGYVSIRGFDSRYNSMEIDGNPIWFSSQNNRGAQINMFPAGIVKETTVYKTVMPNQDANSIGGHIALRTLRAFDGGGDPYLSAGGRIGFYDQNGRVNKGPSGNLYFTGKRAFGPDRKFGLVFGFNYQAYVNTDIYGGVDTYTQANGRDQVGGNVYYDSAYDKLTKNLAIYAKAEVQASDKLYAFLSGNYFDESKLLYLQRTGAFIANSGTRTIIPTGAGAANFSNGQGQIREYDYDIERNAKVIGAGMDYALSDRIAIVLRGNYTDFYNNILTRNLGDGIRLSAFNGSYDINGDVPTVTPSSDTLYNNPANWVFANTASTSNSASYNRTQILEDKVYAARGDVDFNTQGSARGIGAAAGASWTRLDRSFDQTQTYWSLRTGVPALTLAQITPAGSTMAHNDAVKMSWDSFWGYLYGNGTSRTDAAPTTDYGLVEDVVAAHAELYFTGAKFRIIAGMRYEDTSDTINTAKLVRSVVTPVHHNVHYGNWLPNVQGTIDVTPRLRVRAAFTKTLARPDFADFAPGLTTTFDANGVPQNSGTNANLGPRVSTNYDASVEYYLRDGIVSLAVFHKDLTHETFSQRNEVRDAIGALVEVDTIPLNTGSAKVTGIEFNVAKRHFNFLPAPLSGFGLNGNFTYLDGTWNVAFTDGSRRAVDGLRNQPKWLANVQASYDFGSVDLNVNYRRRGRTFTGTFGTTPIGDRWIDGYDGLDAKIAFRPIRGVTLSLEARNLTDSYIRMTTGAYDSVYNSVGAGRSYFAGVRFRY